MGKGMPKSHTRGIFKGHDVPADFLGGGGGGVDFTTSEQDTGLEYDGSIVYQKTLAPTLAIQATTNHTIAHGITGLDKVLQIHAAVKRGGDDAWLHLPYPTPFASQLIQMLVTPTNVEIYAAADWDRSAAIFELDDPIITLLYTKT